MARLRQTPVGLAPCSLITGGFKQPKMDPHTISQQMLEFAVDGGSDKKPYGAIYTLTLAAKDVSSFLQKQAWSGCQKSVNQTKLLHNYNRDTGYFGASHELTIHVIRSLVCLCIMTACLVKYNQHREYRGADK